MFQCKTWSCTTFSSSAPRVQHAIKRNKLFRGVLKWPCRTEVRNLFIASGRKVKRGYLFSHLKAIHCSIQHADMVLSIQPTAIQSNTEVRRTNWHAALLWSVKRHTV